MTYGVNMKNDISDLWKKYKELNDVEHKNQLIEYYFQLVQKISYKVAKRIGWKLQPEELASYGVDGLYSAIEKYDLSRGIKFETYAGGRIWGAMIDELRRQDQVPRTVRINTTKFLNKKHELESAQGMFVTDDEVAKAIGLDVSEFNLSNRKYKAVTFSSLNATVANNEEIKESLNTNMIDEQACCPEGHLLRREFLSKLIGKDFTKLEKKIIYYYFYKKYTMENIAQVVGLSESRISQVYKDIAERLRDKIRRNPNYFDDDIYKVISMCSVSDPII